MTDIIIEREFDEPVPLPGDMAAVDWNLQSHQSHPQVVAFGFHQGRVPNFLTPMTVNQLMDIIQKPDPQLPFVGNRKVDRPRARKFGRYVSDRVLNGELIVPGLILQVEPDYLEFVPKTDLGNGVLLGLLSFIGPVRLRRYVDGQHRGLGFHEEVFDLAEKIRKVQEQIDRHERRNQEVPRSLTSERKALRDKLATIGDMAVPIQVLSTGQKASELLFVDVNDNSLGVRKDFRATLDQRISTNQIASMLAETHPLLQNRVESGQERGISSTNPNWLGMEALARIARYVLRGGSGRFGVVAERETLANLSTEGAKVEAFFDAMAMLPDVQLGIRDVPTMRETTMLGSQTTIIVLAAAWYRLSAFDGFLPGDGMAFLRWVEPKMTPVPVYFAGPDIHPEATFWADKLIQSGNRTFTARQGDINGASIRLALAWRESVGRRVADHDTLYG